MSRSIRRHRSLDRGLTLSLALLLMAANAFAQTGDSVPKSPNQGQNGQNQDQNSAEDPASVPPSAAPNEDDPGSDALPPGHPPVDSMQAAPGATEGALPGQKLSQDTVTYSNTVPLGVIEIHVLDAENHPVAGATVVVQVHRESVSEGNTEAKREAVTDANGVARIDRLLADSAISYRVKLNDGGVTYGMQPFQMNEHAGTLVSIHKYPVARDLKQALVAMQSLVFVEPKDDTFQFEVVYELFNIGRTTWVPDKQSIRLPSHWKAFNAQQSDDDVRAESGDDGVRLVGAVPPGQHQVVFTFQVPRKNAASASFELEMPPNVMMAKVGISSNRNAELSVEGFPDPQPTTSQNGQRLLMTSRTFDRSTHTPTELKFEVRGLPTLGSGRIVAAVVAGVFAAAGLLFAFARRGRALVESNTQSLHDRARERLIEELGELEAARLNGRIGPRTYEETRNTLIEALVRLEPLTEQIA